jgi:hypothetical protein
MHAIMGAMNLGSEIGSTDTPLSPLATAMLLPSGLNTGPNEVA